MFKLVAIHSFRGGTGKSNITANLATLIAMTGKRVGIVDTDLQSPGIHIPFGLSQANVTRTLNDYLWGLCSIEEVMYNLTPEAVKQRNGSIYLAPGSFKTEEITRIVSEGYEITQLSDGLNTLAERLNLDYVFIDTHPGVNNETLLAMALSDMLLMILRPDGQDFEGTAVTVELAQHLGIPKLMLVINKVLSSLDADGVRRLVEKTYNVPVAGVLPMSEDMMLLGSRELFCLRHPKHPLTQELIGIARHVLA
ncbi:MAG: MinD/ParA family protein [Cyanobacteria bacterium]|nr:MinD/ParA family protein [Cyanobacteriota bacterium]MDA0865672.1 MinD/ParA family protein [Cyanobacteriota bacterium]